MSVFFFATSTHPQNLHSFPTRRSSDLATIGSPSAAGTIFPSKGDCATKAWEGGLRCRKTPRNLSQKPCGRSEEHTSELQSQSNLVCRLLHEQKNQKCRFCLEASYNSSY